MQTEFAICRGAACLSVFYRKDVQVGRNAKFIWECRGAAYLSDFFRKDVQAERKTYLLAFCPNAACFL